MRLDHKEHHVLEELELRFQVDTRKFQKLVEKRQVAVLYKSKQDRQEVCCSILFLDSESGCSREYSEVHYTSHCNDKEPKFIERIGRMVAFAGAVLTFLGVEPLPGGELESIARTKSLSEWICPECGENEYHLHQPAQVSEFLQESALRAQNEKRINN